MRKLSRRVARNRFCLIATLLFLLPAVGNLPTTIPASPSAGLEQSGEQISWNQQGLDELLAPVFINKMADFYVAGAAISIVKDDRLVYTRAFGKRDVFAEVPVVADRTLFRIGSVTKTITGVAVMQLVDRGLLDLDADVNAYLSEFKIDDRFDEPVRVRDLLTHTAGFDQLGTGRHEEKGEDVRPLGEFLAENLVRIRPPREVSCYDTYAITLAGYLIEELSQLGYEAYLKRNLFEPLRMQRTNVYVPESLKSDVAVGYEFRGEWFPQRWEFMNTDPASTVNSTVTDMANYMRMLLNGGEFEGRQVLSRRSTEAMLSRQYGNHPELPGYGLTFWEDTAYGVDAFSHGGSMTGFGSYLYLVPAENLGVFVAFSQESGRLADQVISRLVATALKDKVRKPEIRPRFSGGIELSRFTGSYADNMYNHSNPGQGWRRRPFELEADGKGNLVFNQRPAHPVAPLIFQRDDGLLLVFRENAVGEITHLLVRQTVYERLD